MARIILTATARVADRVRSQHVYARGGTAFKGQAAIALVDTIAN
jgi:hypothetical protein